MIIINGKNIKLHRVKNGWTQEELATGLISISYLSKIENDQLTANPEIIEALFLRLGIQDTTVNDIELNEEIKSWYQRIIKRDFIKSEEIYNELTHKIKKNSSFYTNSFFSLISIRYFLTVGRLNEANKLIIELAAVEKDFTNELLFYFHKFKGNYEYLNNEYEKAYHSYKQAESAIDPTISTFDCADIFYSIGMVTAQLLKPYLALYYSKKALELFRGQYSLDKCCDCHLLIGILFLRLKDYDEANSHYQWANKLAKKINYQSLLGVIEHNLGYLYYIQEEFSTAMKHYEQSLKLKVKENDVSKLKTHISLIKICYKQKMDKQLSDWLASAEVYTSNLSAKNKGLFHEYKIFKFLLNKEYDNLVYYISKIALPYFEKENLYQNSTYYSELLADYFKEIRKYKLASYYFEYCKEILKKNINL